MRKFVLVSALCLAASVAHAAQVKIKPGKAATTNAPAVADSIAWDANPAAEQVTAYKVYDHVGADYVPLGTVTAPNFSLGNIAPGPHALVETAVNATGEGPYSNEVAYNAPLPLPTAPQNPHLVTTGIANISVRAHVGVDENVMIGGVIITGATTRVVFRAIGPSLFSHGIQGPLIDPLLELHDTNGALVATNDDWQQIAAGESGPPDGLAPVDPREAVITTSLAPGNFTAIVRGKNKTSGVALVEIYRDDSAIAAL